MGNVKAAYVGIAQEEWSTEGIREVRIDHGGHGAQKSALSKGVDEKCNIRPAHNNIYRTHISRLDKSSRARRG